MMGMRKSPLLRVPIFFASHLVVALLLTTSSEGAFGDGVNVPPELGPSSGYGRVADEGNPPQAHPHDPLETTRPQPEADAPVYVEQLVEEARRRRLHEEHYWHTLLHYKRTITGLKSLVDDPKFFLAPRGKYDPAAELEATIRAFFEPETTGAKHPVCRFVARYYWIKEELNLNPSALPVNECEPFKRLIQEMKPASTTLVFPTSYMNSPASMFGHTLLLFETESKNLLLAYAVNYAAVTTETFGPLFALKGIFGSYRGYFSVLPYYTKLQEYSDIDHRDIWEYPLTFTREETIRSIMHIYELEGIYSDYYFFDENCSYNLLFILDAGRPSLSLTDETLPWVIPLDTIRLVKSAGLITGAVYRPSRTTKIRHIAALMGKTSRALALDVAQGNAEPDQILASNLSREEKARTYDLAVEYLQYLYSRKQLERAVYTDRFLKLLTARSTLGISDGERNEIEPPPRPDEGHRSDRLQIGVGLDKGQVFQETRFRIAYHALTDDDRGYAEGSQLVFLDTAIRYYVSDNQVKLEELELVNIVSLAPRDDLFKPISWKVAAGAEQQVMQDDRKHLVFHLSPGGGVTYRIPSLGLCYAMLETDLDAGEALKEHYAVGIGGSVGIIAGITDRWKVSLSTRGIYYALGDRHGSLDVILTQNYALTPNLAISLDVSGNRTRGFYRTEGKLALNIFF